MSELRTELAAELREYLDALARADRGAALETVRRAAADSSAERVINGILAPAQIEVGNRWARGEWSVADEHAATAITEQALTAVVATGRRDTVDLRDRGHVVFTCAETEWHALPARMCAELLDLDGWSVTFLGASTPADHLERLVRRVEPLAVLTSCTTPLFLPGARRTADAAHSAGVPLLAGGAGFGPDGRWAGAIGADGYASTAAQASVVLEAWAAEPPALQALPPFSEAFIDIETARRRLIEDTIDRLLLEHRPEATLPDADAIDTLIGHVIAAELVGDEGIVEDGLAWWRSVQRARGVAEGVVRDTVETLAACLVLAAGDAGHCLRRLNDAGPTGG